MEEIAFASNRNPKEIREGLYALAQDKRKKLIEYGTNTESEEQYQVYKNRLEQDVRLYAEQYELSRTLADDAIYQADWPPNLETALRAALETAKHHKV